MHNIAVFNGKNHYSGFPRRVNRLALDQHTAKASSVEANLVFLIIGRNIFWGAGLLSSATGDQGSFTVARRVSRRVTAPTNTRGDAR